MSESAPTRAAPLAILASTAGVLGLSQARPDADAESPLAFAIAAGVTMGAIYLLSILLTVWLPMRVACGRRQRVLEIVGYSQSPTLVFVAAALILDQVAPSLLAGADLRSSFYPGMPPSAPFAAAELSGIWVLPLVFFATHHLAPGNEYHALVALSLVALAGALLLSGVGVC